MSTASGSTFARASDAIRRSAGALASASATTSASADADAAVKATPRVVVDFAGQLLGFFAFTWEGACWALVCALVVGNYLARKWRRKMRKTLASAEMKHSLDSQFTTVEHGAMEWINHFLRHLWSSTAGTYADAQAADVLRGIIEGLGSSKPNFVKEVTLTDLTLGSTPPKIQLYTVRYNPTLDYLQFEFNVDWFADAAHGRLMTKIKLAAALPSLRVPIHLTDFGLRGRVLMGFRLTKRVPGVSGVDVSFRGAPKVDVSVRPVGLPVADIPGLYQWIMGKLEEVICKKFLEPRRLYIDVEGKFLQKMASADFLGPGGTLVCRIVSVKGMPKNTGSGYPWVEVSFNGIRRKTCTRPVAKVMEYGGAMAFPLPADTNWKSTEDSTMNVGTVRVRIMDRAAVGTDVFVVGEAVFGAHRRSDTGTHHASLSLGSHAAKSKYGVSGKVSTIAQIEWEVLPPIERWNPLKPAVVESRSSAPLKQQDDASEDDDDDDDEEYDDDDDEDEDEDEDVDTADVFSERSAMSSGHGALSPASRQNSLGTAKSDDEDALGSAAEHIFQLAKLRTLLQSERDHSQSVIEKLKSELAMVKDTVMLERERRAQELKRALLEGVKFFCHTKNSKAALKADETYYLRYHGYKQIFTLHKKHGVKSKPVHTLNIAHVAFAAVGTKHFTMGVTREQDAKETTKAKSARAQEIHSLSASKCLTIVFSTEQELKAEAASIREAKELTKKVKCATGEAEEAEPVVDEPAAFASPAGLAGTGLVGLDLEIPLKGNGRSAREWVDGINALKQVYTATEYPELKYLENVRQKSLKKSADENRDMHKNGPPAVSPEKSKRTSEVVAEIKRTPTSFASVDE